MSHSAEAASRLPGAGGGSKSGALKPKEIFPDTVEEEETDDEETDDEEPPVAVAVAATADLQNPPSGLLDDATGDPVAGSLANMDPINNEKHATLLKFFFGHEYCEYRGDANVEKQRTPEEVCACIDEALMPSKTSGPPQDFIIAPEIIQGTDQTGRHKYIIDGQPCVIGFDRHNKTLIAVPATV